jgi:hypothetical protein
MAEYDIDGWKVPDLKDPDELSYHVMRSGAPKQASSVPKAATPLPAAPQLSETGPETGPRVSQSSVGGFANPFANNKK